MATTTNFGWETPDDTDLVKDGALAMRTLGNSIDTSFVDLKGGTTGQILSKASNTDLDYTWINNDQGDITGVTAGTGISGGGTSGTVTITNSMATEITAAGDIIVGTGSGTFDNLPIGTTGQVLTADTSVSPYKVKWATASSTPSFIGASATKTAANQTLSNATWTTITFPEEEFDTDAFHSTSTNTGRLTIPTGKDGKYRINASIVFDSNATGIRLVRFTKNGTFFQQGVWGSASSAEQTASHSQVIVSLVAGDYVEVQGYQTSGGNLDVKADGGFNQCIFQIEYLGA